MKTRNDFARYQSIHREITRHIPPVCVHASCLVAMSWAVLFEGLWLAGSSALKLSRTFIEAVALVAERTGVRHRRHAHAGIAGMEKRHADFRCRNGRSLHL